ncbi:hypothetical protein [Natronomonas pharaonis]|nr:hypothetical protein [Natronomonas pharaonis]
MSARHMLPAGALIAASKLPPTTAAGLLARLALLYVRARGLLRWH